MENELHQDDLEFDPSDPTTWEDKRHKQVAYLSRWIPCQRCGKNKAEYTWKLSDWDQELLCEACAEYLESKGEVRKPK